MSADYRTDHYKGYAHFKDHAGTVPTWIHVTYRQEGEPALGSFTREDLERLVELARQAWPGLCRDVSGGDVTDEAGPDDVCGCGEPITLFEGAWVHIINPVLSGTTGHA